MIERPGTRLILACCAAAFLLHMPATAEASGNAQRVKLRAEAQDDASDLRFKATYKARSDEDRSRQKLKIRVWNGIPGEILPVSVNGLFFEFMLIDDNGNGRIRFRSDDMPDALPAFAGGDVLTVGPLEGAFEDRDRSGRPNRSRLRLRARGDDGADVTADVKYQAKTRNERLRRRFKVSVDGAVEGDDFDVLVNDELLGTIEVDEWGEGKLHLKAHGAHTDEFPMMQEGDVVTVGDISLTLSAD